MWRRSCSGLINYSEVLTMFEVSIADVNTILRDYAFSAIATHVTELQRYNYEKADPNSKEVRLIIRVDLSDGASIVMRFKNENDVTQAMIESQCQFADLLRTNGIPSPRQYPSGNRFATLYTIHGYEVIVCVEDFVEGEIKQVDSDIARKTGALLAQTHTIAQRCNAHVDCPVLFDPFQKNDLFFYDLFEKMSEHLQGEAYTLSQKIITKYQEYMEVLSPLQEEPRYAVQGDISDCNLYLTAQGEIGLFDFNRCGDNNLYCDAVMQAIFEARLMDYPAAYQGKQEQLILSAFLRGYQSVRPFQPVHRELFPYLYAVVTAFWGMDLVWRENSLQNAVDRGDVQGIQTWLDVIWTRISTLPRMDDLLCPHRGPQRP